jgi:hypothetical protein
MSISEWYLHKADQCALLAKDATEPWRRINYNKEREMWLQLAEEIKQSPFMPKPKMSN